MRPRDSAALIPCIEEAGGVAADLAGRRQGVVWAAACSPPPARPSTAGSSTSCRLPRVPYDLRRRRVFRVLLAPSETGKLLQNEQLQVGEPWQSRVVCQEAGGAGMRGGRQLDRIRDTEM